MLASPFLDSILILGPYVAPENRLGGNHSRPTGRSPFLFGGVSLVNGAAMAYTRPVR